MEEGFCYIRIMWLPLKDLDGAEGKESVTIIQRSGLVLIRLPKYKQGQSHSWKMRGATPSRVPGPHSCASCASRALRV